MYCSRQLADCNRLVIAFSLSLICLLCSLQRRRRRGGSSGATALLRSTARSGRLHLAGPLVPRRRHIRDAHLQRRCSAHTVPEGAALCQQAVPRSTADELYLDTTGRRHNWISGQRLSEQQRQQQFQPDKTVFCQHGAPLLDAGGGKWRRPVLVQGGLQVWAHHYFHCYSERYR